MRMLYIMLSPISAAAFRLNREKKITRHVMYYTYLYVQRMYLLIYVMCIYYSRSKTAGITQ